MAMDILKVVSGNDDDLIGEDKISSRILELAGKVELW